MPEQSEIFCALALICTSVANVMSELKDFFQSTFEEKLLKYVTSVYAATCHGRGRQIQDQPTQFLTPASKLLEKRREMHEVRAANAAGYY